jgi:hypothetical protein
MTHATVTLTGTYQRPDGSPDKGTVLIVPSTLPIIDAGTKVIIISAPLSVTLDSTGSFSVSLPATDDIRLNPTGFGYTITANLKHATLAPVSTLLPASPSTVDMSAVTSVDPSTFAPTATYLARSANLADVANVATARANLGLSSALVEGGYKVALLGASITANNGDSSLVNNPVGGASSHGPSTVGIVTWANMVLRQPLDLAINVSQGGLTSSQILGNVNAALAVNPNYVIGHDWWINDILGSVSIVTSQANTLAIIAACNVAGATVIMTDYLPLASYTTGAMIAQHFAMMDWARSIQNRGFMFVPICDDIVDTATGYPLTNYTYDGAHPSPLGAHALGLRLAEQIGHLFRGANVRQPVATSVDAGSGFKGNPKELVANPMPYGTLGAGTAAFYALSGTGTPVGSIVAATDHPNLLWQRCTFTTDGYILVSIGVNTGSGLTYGTLTLTPNVTKMRSQFEWRMPNVSQPGKIVSVNGWQSYTPASESNYCLQDTSSAAADQGLVPDDNLIYTAMSRERLLPAGSTATAYQLVFYGQAGAVIDFRRASLVATN